MFRLRFSKSSQKVQHFRGKYYPPLNLQAQTASCVEIYHSTSVWSEWAWEGNGIGFEAKPSNMWSRPLLSTTRSRVVEKTRRSDKNQEGISTTQGGICACHIILHVSFKSRWILWRNGWENARYQGGQWINIFNLPLLRSLL